MRRSKRGREETNRKTARKQREVIRDVMLSAGLCATWLTLDELAKLTQYPPASISAQLRHLRKARFGGYAVAKRRRAVNPAMRAEGIGPLWEYAVELVQRVVVGRKGKRGAISCGTKGLVAQGRPEHLPRTDAQQSVSDGSRAWA